MGRSARAREEGLQGLGGAILEAQGLAEAHVRGQDDVGSGRARAGQGAAERGLGFGPAAFGRQHAAPGQPQRCGRVGGREGLFQEGAVAGALAFHGARVAVAGMQDLGRGGAHREPGLGHGFAQALVHGIAEAQALAVGDQADLRPRGFGAVGTGRTHAEGVGLARIEIGKMGGEPIPGGRGQLIVGVQPQDPLAARQIQGMVARGREIVRPGEVVHLGAEARGHRLRAVPAPGIHQDALGLKALQGAEQGREAALLVAGDDGDREHGIAQA